MPGFGRKVTAAAIAVFLCAAPTAAIGAAPAGHVTSPQPAAQINPWLALSAMTTSSSAASAAAAAQGDGGPGSPPIASLAVILATIATAIYILIKDDHGHFHFVPLSPA